jgi:hypothetical protein
MLASVAVMESGVNSEQAREKIWPGLTSTSFSIFLGQHGVAGDRDVGNLVLLALGEPAVMNMSRLSG